MHWYKSLNRNTNIKQILHFGSFSEVFFIVLTWIVLQKYIKKREEKLTILTSENFGLKNIKTIKPTILGAFIEAFYSSLL